MTRIGEVRTWTIDHCSRVGRRGGGQGQLELGTIDNLERDRGA